MSATMSIPTTLPELQALRLEVENRIAGLIGSSGAVVAFAKTKGRKEPKEPKAKRASGPSAWGDWSKKVFAEQKAEIEAFKAASEVKQGAHLKWLGNGGDKKGAHEEPGPGSERFGSKSAAWLAFKAEWDVAHPKGSSAASVSGGSSVSGASDAEGEAPAAEAPKKRRGPKKVADMTPEELAARAAKKALKDGKKKAEEDTAREASPFGRPGPAGGGGAEAAPAAAPAAEAEAEAEAEEEAAEEEEAVELLPHVIDGTRYVRPGVKEEGGAIRWASGDLWFYKKSAPQNRGDYVGCVDESGIIDSNADEPNLSA